MFSVAGAPVLTVALERLSKRGGVPRSKAAALANITCCAEKGRFLPVDRSWPVGGLPRRRVAGEAADEVANQGINAGRCRVLCSPGQPLPSFALVEPGGALFSATQLTLFSQRDD